MIKSKSYTSQLTACQNKPQLNSHYTKISYKTTHPTMLFSPKSTFKQSKFPKNFVHKATEMNIFKQTQQKDRKPCLKVIQQGRRVTMLHSKSLQGSLKKGEFSHLSRESPIKPLQVRNFQDFGAKMNRKKTTTNHNNLSLGVGERLTGNLSTLQGHSQWSIKQKKHYQIKSDFKANFLWDDSKKRSKQTKINASAQAMPKNSYLQTHMKYKVFK